MSIYVERKVRAMDKLEFLIDKLNKNEIEEKKNTLVWVLAIVGAVVAIAAIAYGVYRYFAPNYLEDFEDDFEDDFDDYFEDEKE